MSFTFDMHDRRTEAEKLKLYSQTLVMAQSTSSAISFAVPFLTGYHQQSELGAFVSSADSDT
jgi:hypothetical protein